jgi:PA domain/Secretion system C-terminal sorting domain
MKKILHSLFVLTCTITASNLFAQKVPAFFGTAAETNWYVSQAGRNVAVTAPSSIAGIKDYTIGNNSDGSGDWGRAIDSSWFGISVVKAIDTLGNNPYTNASALNGKIALVFRGGGITFYQKALYAQQAGAVACVIVNNIPGGPIGMSSTGTVPITIPVIMISQADGNAINAQLAASQTVTMNISLWKTNVNNDLALVNNGLSLFHATMIPQNQLTRNATAPAYNYIPAAYVANFGNNTQTGVKLVSSLSFTPTSGQSNLIRKDSSVVLANFPTIDSIICPLAGEFVLPTTASTGVYQVDFTVKQNETDNLSNNNIGSTTLTVTDSIFSKGRYDLVKGEPIVGSGYAFGSSSDMSWGPLYYVANGGYAARRVQFTVSAGSNSPTLDALGTCEIYLMKWTDGSNAQPKDSVIETGELNMVGIATRSFTAADSNFKIYSANFINVDGSSRPFARLDSNSWYWVCTSLPTGFYLGVDGSTNYYVREYARTRITPNTPYYEFFAPITNISQNNFGNDPTVVVSMNPFDAIDVDSARFAQQKKGLVPAMPLHISKSIPTTGTETLKPIYSKLTTYPNPATNLIKVDFDLLESADKVTVRLVDGFGRPVIKDVLNNTKSGTYTFNTEKLPSGNYYVIINNGTGVAMRPVVIMK